MDKYGLNISSSQLMDLKKQLNRTVGTINRALAKRNQLIDFKGYTNKEEELLNSKLNPEDYYKFRFFEWGCEIVYTHWRYDEKTETKYQDQDNYYYGIKYYGCVSKLFNTKHCKLDCFNNNIYGSFTNFDEAKSYFKKAVADILNQLGYIGLDPLLLY